MKKLKVIGGVIVALLLIVLTGCFAFKHKQPTIEETMRVQGYEIIETNITENLVTLSFKDNDGEEYLIEYLADDLEDLVCHKGVYEYAKVQRVYDCSTVEKTHTAMIEELAKQAIEIIEMEKDEMY